MTYLLTGYFMTGTETYDIKWTMPQCVLTLRLSGLAFDLYDGCQPLESLSSENKKVALKQVPSFLEVLAYSFYPASFLVGPQFPMKRYQDFVSGILKDSEEGVLPDCLIPSLKRTLTGIGYLAVYQIGFAYINDDYLLNKEYEDLSFLLRCVVLGIWGHLALYKYISCWLMVEGVCIASGITYNGKDEKGNSKWDGLSNVDLKVFEGATVFNHYVESFNINTNHWVAQYVYKRLKFLGNKYFSQLGVLIFLAIWHGLHSGYYICFFLEFICLVMEKDLQSIINRNGNAALFLQRPGIKQLKWIILKTYTLVFMGYCMAPFVLLSYSKWWHVHKSVFLIGHILWMPWMIYRPIVKKLLPPKAHTS
ncbi:lysophosphatidylcholine acyltransferase 3 protein nessy isoform X2 [Lycorma delicatula]